jgi:hypothetical protein
MNIQPLLLLLFRFANPFPAEPMLPIADDLEAVIESPAYIHTETGEMIYMGEGQDGTEVNLADLF